MLLESKNAVIYGAGGGIGAAVARAFAREGATVFLTGRTPATLDPLAEEIVAAGGKAEAAVVDALDGRGVRDHVDGVVAKAGSLDISFNLIGHGDVHGTPLAEMPLEDFERPVISALRSTFLTAQAAARHMIEQKSGVLLAFGGSGDPMRDYYIGGTQVAFETIEALRRQLSAELGPHGIRFVTLQSGGVPETLPEDFEGREAIVERCVSPTMLGRAATLEDVGNVAVFAASDHAAAITAGAINISCGAIVDR